MKNVTRRGNSAFITWLAIVRLLQVLPIRFVLGF
jgi:hypothetical protein